MNSRSCDVISSAPGCDFRNALEPDDRLDVEVVGRLVHQQDVGPRRAARAPSPRASSSRRTARRRRRRCARRRSRGRAAPRAPAPRGRSRPRCSYSSCTSPKRARMRSMSPAFAGIAHRVLQRLELVVQVAEPAAAGDRLVEHRAAGHLLDVLAEVADGQLLRHRHVAFVRRSPRRRSSGTASSCRRRSARPARPSRPD